MQSCFLCFENCVQKTHKKATILLRRSYLQYTQNNITASNPIVSYRDSLPTDLKLKDRGNKIMMGMVVKAKIGKLEEEVRADNSRMIRKELTGVVQCVSWSRRFLVGFQNGCENNMSFNQLTVVIV